METLFTLNLPAQSSAPLHRQVYEQIRTAILTGRLRSQQKLPASRQLAQSLGVSRTTITQSYDQLISEGYLKTRRGAGTFVSAEIPDDLLNPPEGAKTPQRSAQLPSRLASQLPSQKSTSPPPLSAYGQRLLTTAQPSQQTQNTLSFRYWRPDLSLFPVKQWQRLVNRHSLSSTAWMTYSDEPLGYEPLRSAIATYLSQARAVACQPEQIIITQGTQQALGLIAQVLLNEGDAIAIEDPGYLSARRVFSSHGALPVPIPVDEQGITVDALKRTGQLSPKLVYVTPSHQFPTGVLMSLPRRLALLEWAQQTGGMIVEDDYDSEYRYGGRPIPALQGLDTYQRVLYVGTFSKVMFPALRLGYMVLPPSLVPVFRRAKWVCDRQCSLLHQAALAEFINEGHLAKHIRRMRTVYAQRREVLVSELQTLGVVDILGDPAGLHVMARLPEAQKFAARAADNGVSLFSAAPYYCLGEDISPEEKSERERAFVFGFGGLSEGEIRTAIALIRAKT